MKNLNADMNKFRKQLLNISKKIKTADDKENYWLDKSLNLWSERKKIDDLIYTEYGQKIERYVRSRFNKMLKKYGKSLERKGVKVNLINNEDDCLISVDINIWEPIGLFFTLYDDDYESFKNNVKIAINGVDETISTWNNTLTTTEKISMETDLRQSR